MILVAFTRPWAMKYLKPHLIRTNYEQAIGENVCLTETVDNQRGTGTAVYKGTGVDGESQRGWKKDMRRERS